MQISQQYAKQYILAGKSLITVVNTKTGNQFTYIIRQKKDKVTGKIVRRWYVKHNSDYLGYITDNGFYYSTGIDVKLMYSQAMEVWAWIWLRITEQTVPDYIHILRSDFCGACGRQLTDSVSLSFGIGPECRKKLGIE